MKQELKYGALLGYINMIVNLLITIFYTPLLLHMMGQSEYGLYSLVASVIGYFSIMDMGFGNAIIRFVSKSKAKNDNREFKINGMFLFLYTIIGLIALIIGLALLTKIDVIFATSLSSTEIKTGKILFAILLTNVSLSFPLSVFDSYITANEKFIFAKTLLIVKHCLRPLIMIPLLFMGYKSIAMAATIAGINIFCHFLSLIYCYKKLHFRSSFDFKKFDFKLLKEIGAYSFFVFLNIIVDSIFTNTDQIILGIVSGTTAVSIYALANQVQQLNTQFSTVISGLFLPRVTKLLEENDGRQKVSKLFIKVSRIQLYIMALILSGFVLFGKQFIILWAGKEYIAAYYIVLILIVPAIIPLTQNIGISIIQAMNIHKFRSIIYIIIAILNIIVSIPLAKMYQGIGAAIGTALSNLIGQIIIMNIYYYKKVKIDIPSYWKYFMRFMSQVCLLTIIYFLVIQLFEYSIISVIVLAIFYCLAYFIVVFFNMNNEEKYYVKKIYNRILKKN